VTAWRTVKDDATGKEERRRVIVNIKPFTVYAQDQVEGPPLPAFTPTRLSGQAPAELWEGLASFLEEKGYSVTRERPHSPGADGETDPIAKAVRIDPKHAPLHQLVTLGHEAAHVDLDHVTDMANYRTHRGPFEIEAESSAFIFFATHGIDSGTSSFEYIDGWCRNDLDLILKTASRSIESAQRLSEAVDGPEIDHLPRPLAVDLSNGVEPSGVGVGL
jgi:antirestriction protein ArdC